jgi:Bacterial Ig-like domain (group 3)
MDGSNPIGTCTIHTGSCQAAISNLGVGTHHLVGIYSGDPNTASATSPVLDQVVEPAPTSVTLMSSVNPSVIGQGILLTASVDQSPGLHTGKVHFEDKTGSDEVLLGSCDLVGNACSINLSTPLPVGTRKIIAEYSGDSYYAGSTSSEYSQVVLATAGPINLVADTYQQNLNGPVNFTITVDPQGAGIATGTIQLKDGSNSLGSPITLINGTASFLTSSLSMGSHAIQAIYSGDTNHSSGTSPTITIVIQSSTTLVLSSNTSSTSVGDLVVFSVFASSPSGTPDGNIYLEEEIAGQNDVGLGSCLLSLGSCTIAISSLTTGTHTIYAEYYGGGAYAPASSNSLSQTVITPAAPNNNNQRFISNGISSKAITTTNPLVIHSSPTGQSSVNFSLQNDHGSQLHATITIEPNALPEDAFFVITPIAEKVSAKSGILGMSITVYDSVGTPISRLSKPISITLGTRSAGMVPAVSTDGFTWTMLPRFTFPGFITDSVHAGYVLSNSGVMTIITDHLTNFSLMKKQLTLYGSTATRNLSLGKTLQVGLRGSSGLGDVTFRTTTPEVCLVTSNGLVTGIHIGSCRVYVSRSSDGMYLDGSSAIKNFSILP